MILLCSNAENIYWLGRYLIRIKVFCQQIPFTDDQKAIDFSHAFCLPAYDAASLNELSLDPKQPYSLTNLLITARNNVQELRALLSSNLYAELNQILKNACQQPSQICMAVQECHDILESEVNQDVYLFLTLGEKIEQLDEALRFKTATTALLKDLDIIVDMVGVHGWTALTDAWLSFRQDVNLNAFYDFNDQLTFMYENHA